MAQAPATSTKPRITAATRRRNALRKELWPDVESAQLWNRAKFTGFTTIPRTLSVIMHIIDTLDQKSAARVYLDLWCRAFDDYVVEIRDEYEAAFSSGYVGQRAVRSWRERIAVLERSGFVRAYKTPHGSYRVVLVLDPHPIVEMLRTQEKIDDESWYMLRALLIAIGEGAKE